MGSRPVPFARTAAALAYVTLLPAIVLLLIKDYRRDAFVRFHALQSILFHVSCLILGAALVLASVTLVPGMGFLVVFPLYALAVLVTWVLLIMKAWREEFFELPLLGDFALSWAGG